LAVDRALRATACQRPFHTGRQNYTLAVNNGSNALHGGIKGFDKVVWQVVRAEYTPKGAQLELSYTSPDGEEGYPGTLTVTALYTLTPEATVCAWIHRDHGRRHDREPDAHSYFNLAATATSLAMWSGSMPTNTRR